MEIPLENAQFQPQIRPVGQGWDQKKEDGSAKGHLVNTEVQPLEYLGHLLVRNITKEENRTSKGNAKAVKVTLELRCDRNREKN